MATDGKKKPLRRGTVSQPPDRQSGALPILCYGAIKSRVWDLNPCSRLMRPPWNLSILTRRPSPGIEPGSKLFTKQLHCHCAMTAESRQPETIRHLQLGRLICCQLHHAYMWAKEVPVSFALLNYYRLLPYAAESKMCDSNASSCSRCMRAAITPHSRKSGRQRYYQ